jgi:GNAT superfamily N-acetyltransferase
MWTVSEIKSPNERREICAGIITALPQWFGIEIANASYIDGVANEDCFIVRGNDATPLGMISLKHPFPNNADLYWFGVLPEYHKKGIGRVLMKAAFERARSKNCTTMTVETLGPSDPDPGYTKTRAFYTAMGFRPLFELSHHGLENPLLYMLKEL